MSVYLLCRNPERGQDAEDRIREATYSDTVYFHQLDLVISIRSEILQHPC